MICFMNHIQHPDKNAHLVLKCVKIIVFHSKLYEEFKYSITDTHKFSYFTVRQWKLHFYQLQKWHQILWAQRDL